MSIKLNDKRQGVIATSVTLLGWCGTACPAVAGSGDVSPAPAPAPMVAVANMASATGASYNAIATASAIRARRTVRRQTPAQEKKDNQQQQAASDFTRGVLTGRVVDTNGKPVAGATVALQDKNGKVVAWTQTGPDGSYRMAADTLKALRLEPSRRKGFLEKVTGAVGQAVRVPVNMAKGVIGGVSRDPGGAARAVATAGLTGNPLPLAGIAGNALNNPGKAPVRSVGGERQIALTNQEMRESLLPGEVVLLVNAPGYKPLRDKAGAFWMERPVVSETAQTESNTAKNDKNKKAEVEVGPQAFLETAKLAPQNEADTQSVVEPSALLLTDAGITPVLAPAGSVVRVAAKLQTPPAPTGTKFAVRVFAREGKKGALAELLPQSDGSYAGDLTLDENTPDGDTTICIVALRAEPVEVKINTTKEHDPLVEFARDLDEIKPGKDYGFDPRIFAAENRLEVTLTILDPDKATPTTATPVVKSSAKTAGK